MAKITNPFTPTTSEGNNGGSGFSTTFAGGGTAAGKIDVANFKPSLPSSGSSSVGVSIEEGDPAAYIAAHDVNDAVMRVAFTVVDPYIPYTNGRFFIQGGQSTTSDINTFGGVFETDQQNAVFLIKEHLIGQSLGELATAIRNYPNVLAEVLNNAQFLDVRCLQPTPFLNGTERWVYFFKADECQPPNPNENLKGAIKFYFTSVEPSMDQLQPSQSLGGFISPSVIYNSTATAESVGFYDSVITMIDDDLASFDLIQIGDEIIRVDSWDGVNANIAERNAYGTPVRFHPNGTKVFGIVKNDIFDFSLSEEENAQYRCIAIRNTHPTEIARNVKVFFKLSSRNNLSNTRFAIEIPRSEFMTSTATSGTTSTVVDSTLAGQYDDNHFQSTALKFTSGPNNSQERIVTAYNGSTGTFTLDNALSNLVEAGHGYRLETAPSQRVPSGVTSPVVDQDTPPSGPDAAKPHLITEFSGATFAENGVSINVGENRTSGSELKPNEVVYVWIERKIDDSNPFFLNDRAMVSLSYSKV
tara:strand:+ start:329555 stop:331138 length:1584 start_codon:yes stop_codon:yes gene_type:complete